MTTLARSATPSAATAGLLLIALAGACLAGTATGDIAALDTALGSIRVTGSGPLAFIGVLMLGLALVAARRRDARLTLLTVTVGAFGAAVGALLAIAAPTDEIFAPFGTPDYRSGGYFAIAAFLTGAAGSALAAATFPWAVQPREGRHPAGPAAIAIALVSLIIPFLGILAIGLGRLARATAAAGGGRDRNGNVGIALGAVTATLWTAGGLVGVILGLTHNL
ncbi:MAG: hypothetical protein AB1416_02645 [Actinomycetota bacterium]